MPAGLTRISFSLKSMALSFAKLGADADAFDPGLHYARRRGFRGRVGAISARRPFVNLSDAAVTQVMIPVDDYERGIAFYRDTLGIPLLFTAPPMMAFFRSGSVRLLVGVLPPGQTAQRG